ILNSVPAMLKSTTEMINKIKSDNSRIFTILGPAGSGKSTALKQIALYLSETQQLNVFFLNQLDDIKSVILELDERNADKYYLCIERIAEVAIEVSDILMSHTSEKVIFITAENSRIWSYRAREHFHNVNNIIQDFSSISEDDVHPILTKIENYGNWARLSKMSLRNRRLEIIRKSKKQLLIGLLEATSGEGYDEIIKREFSSITNDSERALLLLCSLATMQRSEASEATLTRAMSILNLNPNVYELSSRMIGVVNYDNGFISTRHRVYVERVISLFVSAEEMKNIIKAYIQAFSVYKFPIVVNINKKEAAIYKGLVNFKFLKKILRDDDKIILEIYEHFEKALELEGLFLLQYGLALRSYGRNKESLEKLSLARVAFPESPHIEHAYALQLLIIAEIEATEPLSLEYLEEAKEQLRTLDKGNKFEGDRYPIVTLSAGHIKVMNALGRVSEAKILAKTYHDEIKIRFRDHQHDQTSKINRTIKFLMTYSLTGKITDISFDD
uniref:P-loop NTPase n=1 Tax=uncultured Rheinheimera sp. TaxID=400532 RepID=UPI0025943511